MRILLDNCMHVGTKTLFPGHEVSHVLDRGWDKLANGKLLAAAADAGFDVFVTVDKNIKHQQNLARLPLAVLELDLPKNRLQDVRRVAPHFPATLEQVARFNFVSLDQNGQIETLAERPRTIEPPRQPPPEPTQPERNGGRDPDIER